MITISNNSNIEYTTGDTFKIIVSSDTSFLAGSVLRFQIAENNGDSVVINNNYNLSDSGDFTISLTTSETAKLVIGDYVYRITIIDADRDITTEKSGNFKVKWGAKSYQTSTMSLSASNTKALDKKLQNEIVERTEADTELDSKIEAEILLRENIDSSLQTAIDLKADKENESDGFNGGYNSEATSAGGAIGGFATATSGGAVGYESSTENGGASGSYSRSVGGGAIGSFAHAYDGGAVGSYAETENGFAGGKDAKTWLVDEDILIDAVQLGTGINQTAKTLQVYDYTMMNADGTIPEDRIPVLSELQTNVNLLSPVKDVLNVQLDVTDLDGQINLTQANSPASQFGFSKPYQISAIGEASGVNVFVGVGSVTAAFTVKVFATTANIVLSGGKYNYEYMDKEIEVSLSESAWVYLDLTDIKTAFEGKELLTVGFYTTDTTVTRPFYTYYCPSSMQLSNAFIGNNSWHYYLNGGWGGNTSTSNINMIYVLFQKVNGYSSDSTDLVSAVDTNKYQPDNALRVVCLSDIHFGGTPTEITETSTSPNIYDIDRLNIITNSINSENAVKPIDFVIIAGDLLTLSGSAQGADSFKVPKLKEFKQLLIDKLDMPVFCIGGNHDGFTNEQWVSALGHNRRFSIHTDNYAFICIDVYSDQRWQIYSKTDLGYTGICPNDEAKAWVSGELQKAKTADKKVIFVWHTFYGNGMDTPGNYSNHSDTYFHLLTAGNDNLEQLSCLSDITADMIDEGIITAGTTPTYAQVRDYYISLINQSDSYFATLCTQYDDIIAGCISGHSHLQYLNGSPVYCKKDINCGNFGAISRLNNSSGTYTGKSGYTFVTINGVEYADITNSAYSYKALEVTPEKLYSYTVYPEITYPTFQPSADTTTQSYAYKGSLSIDAKTRYSAADFDLKSIANMKYKALNDRIARLESIVGTLNDSLETTLGGG